MKEPQFDLKRPTKLIAKLTAIDQRKPLNSPGWQEPMHYGHDSYNCSPNFEKVSIDATQVQATLGMRYGNIRKIGAGGMAAVFSAYDAVLKRAVAVKLVFEANNASELAVRFQQEAKLASRLNHPNIVKVLDFGVGQNGTLYLIMDLVEGASLQQKLKESGPMNADAAIPMFIQICDALAHAHAQGVVHRDLKPSNIMIAEEESKHTDVRIVDFGLAKVVSGDQKITRTGVLVGTPLYASPEQIQSRPVDQRSDIYSFGCAMMEVLTGSPPFRGPTPFETYDMHVSQPAPRLLERGFSHEYAEELDRIIALTLEKDRNDRYANFFQLKSDLINLLPEESKSAVYEVQERYAQNQFQSRSFMSQHKATLIAIGGSITIGGALVFDKISHQRPVEVDTSKARFSDIGFTENEWRFFCREQNGLPTWTNIDCRMSDKHFKQLVGKKVRSISLYAMRLDGSGLKYLKNEPIERLSVAESKIVDENLHYIGDLKGLNSLDISYTWITDSGVATISKLPKLEKLGMAGCDKLTAKSIESVCRFAPELNDLNISLTPLVGKPGFEALQGLPKLKTLDISLNQLTDDTIAPIFELQNLEELAISKNKLLTDATLVKLRGLKKLRVLKIDECSGFSAKAIADLEKALPHCTFTLKAKPRKAPDQLLPL